MNALTLVLLVLLLVLSVAAVWTTSTAIQQFATTLLTAAKAFLKGLNSVFGQNADDPHGAFNGTGLLVVVLVGIAVAAIVLR
jgi:hypothetical protein